MLRKVYEPAHQENRMKHEGDVVHARQHYYQNRSPNLMFLLRNRFEWMNEYIRENDKGIEVGCGAGVSRDFIQSKSYLLTDYANHDWIDIKNVDALNTPFNNNEFDFVVSSNMIHHVPYPLRFFNEMYRILKPGGYLLVQEINASLLMRFVLRLMRHEGYSFERDVFDETVICTNPNDLWSANTAIPNLLFDDLDEFQNRVPYFRVVKRGFSECFTFLNSGGVIAKTFYIPLPYIMLRFSSAIDKILARSFPQVFALQQQIVLQKK